MMLLSFISTTFCNNFIMKPASNINQGHSSQSSPSVKHFGERGFLSYAMGKITATIVSCRSCFCCPGSNKSTVQHVRNNKLPGIGTKSLPLENTLFISKPYPGLHFQPEPLRYCSNKKKKSLQKRQHLLPTNAEKFNKSPNLRLVVPPEP
jgi:hypothetical protein